MTLRPYQQAAVDAVWDAYRKGARAPLIVAPTGAGKSHIIADVCRRVQAHSDYRVLVLTHRKELVAQNAAKIAAAAPDLRPAIFAASFGRREFGRVTCAQIQSLARLLAPPAARLAIIDEAHLVPHAGHGQYRTVLAALREIDPELRLLGLTATDYRLGGGRLHEGPGTLFDSVAHAISVQGLIDAGYLAEPVPYGAGMDARLARVKKSAGEFHIGQQDRLITRRVAAIVARIIAYADGRRSILIFCPGVEAVEAIAQALRGSATGPVGAVTGGTPAADRDRLVRDFRAGQLRYLVNCDVLTTGFDAPETDVVVLLRATASPGLYVQMVGRGMRPAPGKADCRVVDFGGNAGRHGPIDDVTAPERGQKAPPKKLKECPACFRLCPVAAAACIACGAEFPPPKERGRKLPDQLSAAAMLRAQGMDAEVLRCTYVRGRGKDGRPDHIRAEYSVDTTLDPVREFFCPEHAGLASDIWRRRRQQLGSRADTVDQCVEEMDSWPTPTRLRIARAGRYWNVRSAVYEAD